MYKRTDDSSSTAFSFYLFSTLMLLLLFICCFKCATTDPNSLPRKNHRASIIAFKEKYIN